MGANVKAKLADGTTALMNAYTDEQIEVLVEAGADVLAKDNDGKTALMRKSTPFAKATEKQKELLSGSGVKGIKNKIAAARDHLRLRREHKTFMRKATRAIARGVIKGLRDARKGR